MSSDALKNVFALKRAVKQDDHAIKHRLMSIREDAEFLESFASAFAGIALFANLRCGLWYARSFGATCYFKSTDGHHGNWSFPVSRLNLHLAKAAAERGAVVIADSTRRGKRFPDSFSKTVPIWCAVMNRAVARTRAALKLEDPSAKGWDEAVHLPVWVSDSERSQIDSRLAGWTETLLACGADLKPIAAALRKPLRALWADQETNTGGWVRKSRPSAGAAGSADGAADAGDGDDDFGFTFDRSGADAGSDSAALDAAHEDAEGSGDDEGEAEGDDAAAEGDDDSAEAEAKAGGETTALGDSKAGAESKDEAGAASKTAAQPYESFSFTPVFCVSVSRAERGGVGDRRGWTYIQGAGDDEDGWAMGLTPALFWANADKLLDPSINQDECVTRIRKLVAAQKQGTADVKAAGGAAAAGESKADAGSKGDAKSTQPAAASSVVSTSFAIGDTGISVGSSTQAPGESDGTWSQHDAVLFCSAKQTDAKHADAKQRAVLCLAISDDKREKQSFSASFNAAVAFAHTHLSAKRRVLILSAPDCSVALAVTMAVLVALFDEKFAALRPLPSRAAPTSSAAADGADSKTDAASAAKRASGKSAAAASGAAGAPPLFDAFSGGAAKEGVRRASAFVQGFVGNAEGAGGGSGSGAQPSRQLVKQIARFLQQMPT